jgi:DNA adenine methylase
MSETRVRYPTRPVVRWHGGKWKLAPWIISILVGIPHRIYTESYGGGGSVLLRKPRVYSEVYNDLDGEICNVFRVLRNPTQARELERLLRLTPFARKEFELSYLSDGDPIEQARRTIMRTFMGYGSNANNCATGFRANSNRSGTMPAHDWMHYPDQIPAFTARLAGVVIENRPAIEVIQQHDGPQTLHYVDPPYLHSTRGKRMNGNYRHEMTDADHCELAGVLKNLRGAVVISGYPHSLYDELYAGWERIERETHADGARDRIECLWISPNAAAMRLPLFTEVAP